MALYSYAGEISKKDTLIKMSMFKFEINFAKRAIN
jgi:hypothetical protein